MAKYTFQSIKGTFDVLPERTTSDGTTIAGSTAWQYVESIVRETLHRFSFQEIRTPIFEDTELIARGIGQLTDIVSKEMFAFERGDTQYVLRPEITAPVMRAYLQHHLAQRGGTQKLYYIGPCFRAERPQKGRYRQFHQFGVEVIGSADARADVEVIASMMAIYETLGLTETTLRINTLGTAESRPRYRKALQDYFGPLKEYLSETSLQRLETNPLRILDTKDPEERALLDEAPRLIDFIEPESAAHYAATKTLLDELEIDYVEDPFLVRGLDYYTLTAFELESPNLGAQSALAGGGRYDLLATEIGSSQPAPAVGFAAGMERLFLALEAQNIPLPDAPIPDVFFVALGEQAIPWVFKRVQRLRREGYHVAMDLKGRSFKAQMREANRRDARYTCIVGEDELKRGVVQVKHMETGTQTQLAAEELVFFLESGNVQRSS